MAAYKVTTAPAEEPITLAELKLQARIDGSTDDDILEIYIQAAREACEHRIGRPIVSQTIRRTSDDWPADDDIELLRAPVQSITSVTYIDANGDTQTVDSSTYTLDNADEHGPAWVLLQDGEEWPETGDYGNAVMVTFVAGYGAATAVPAALKAWILMAAAWMADHRTAELPMEFADGLLDKFRMWAA